MMEKEASRYYALFKRLYERVEIKQYKTDYKRQLLSSQIFNLNFIKEFNNDDLYIMITTLLINSINSSDYFLFPDEEKIEEYYHLAISIKDQFDLTKDQEIEEYRKYIKVFYNNYIKYDRNSDYDFIIQFFCNTYSLFEDKGSYYNLIISIMDFSIEEFNNYSKEKNFCKEVINYIQKACLNFPNEKLFFELIQLKIKDLNFASRADYDNKLIQLKKELKLELRFIQESDDSTLTDISKYLAARQLYFYENKGENYENKGENIESVEYEEPNTMETPEQHNSFEVKSDFLNQYAFNMTLRKFITNPAISREKEIEKIELVIISPKKSPILIGNPGVGKTAIVEGFANCLMNGTVPDILKNRKIFQLTMESLLAGSQYRGDVEERMSKLVEELLQHPDIILFIDEIHTIMGAGATRHDSHDVANMLKPHIDRGAIKIIGATTQYEYEKYMIKDAALCRRFNPIYIDEPSIEVTKDILKGTIPLIENQTRVLYPFNEDTTNVVLHHLIEVSNRENQNSLFITSRPELPLTLLEMAFSYAALNSSKYLREEDIVNAIYYEERLSKDKREESAKQLRLKLK